MSVGNEMTGRRIDTLTSDQLEAAIQDHQNWIEASRSIFSLIDDERWVTLTSILRTDLESECRRLESRNLSSYELGWYQGSIARLRLILQTKDELVKQAERVKLSIVKLSRQLEYQKNGTRTFGGDPDIGELMEAERKTRQLQPTDGG
jgi:hypothetical protein